MFKFCQDLVFLEQLVAAGFNAGFFVVAADDPLFYSGPQLFGIYAHFRASAPIKGLITKPSGKRDETVQISGPHQMIWREARVLRYACVPVLRTARPNEALQPTRVLQLKASGRG